MPNFPFVIGDALQIGTATITATGNAVVLPTGTQVGSNPIASAVEVATGGGPKISNIQITNPSWTVLDDTAVDTAGGYILITGTNFVSGCLVYFNQTPANSVAFVGTTSLRITVPALAAGTYIVYVINPDGGTAIRVPGLTASVNPAWQTASGLPEQYDNTAITLSLVAVDATGYTLTSGSLPPGLSLNTGTGVISGTVTTVTVDTTYTFTVTATDAELQDSPRTFTVTIAVSDPYFRLTTLLLGGEQGNTVVRDSSVNNFNLTVFGDARASNFTPYGGAWSLRSNDRSYITIPASADFDLLNTDFTVEFWFNPSVFNTMSYSGSNFFGNGLSTAVNGWSMGWSGSGTIVTAMEFRTFASGAQAANSFSGLTVNFGTWYHIVLQRNGSGAGNLRLFVNGVLQGTAQTANTYSLAGGTFVLGSGSYLENATYSGNADYYISNLRLTKSAVYDIVGFTPPTSNLTQLTNTTLLICQSNRLVNNGTNAGAITSSGHTSTRVSLTSFNPFNITNTGDSGSAYFDGTGDYVTTPTSQTPLALDTSNFTVECWVYFSSGQLQTNPCILSSSVASGLANTILLQMGTQPSTQIALWVNNVHLTASATNNNLVFNAWNHIAICRTGGSAYSFFINGQAVNSVASNSTSLTANDWRIGYWFSGAHALLGYIADFRIIKGTALYSSNFTPPTVPLTAIANTQLLTLQYRQPHNNHGFQDSSSNNFLITRNGNASQGAFTPFSPGGYSAYFNGSAYLQIASNAAFTLGSSADFTVECWIYPTANFASSGNAPSYIVTNYSSHSNGYTNRWGLAGLNNTIGWYNSVGTFGTQTGSLSLLNKWTHIAAVRSNSTIRIYIDGVQNGTPQTTNQDYTTDSVLYIGNTAAGNYFTGYIRDVRVVKGTAIYTSNFTPPTSSLASVANTSVLTCQNNRFIDNSTNNFAITSVSTSIQAFSPFAPTQVYSPAVHGGSAYFDGTGDYINTGSDVGFNLGTGNFTWEFWTYITASPADGNLLFQPRTPAGIDAVLFGYKSGSNFTIYATTNGGSSWNLFSNTVIIAVAEVLNRWTHWAFTRNGSTYTVYVDGVAKTTGTSASQISQATNVFTIGTSGITGYFSSFRFVKGQALSTGNFTPPVAPVTTSAIGWSGSDVAASLTGTVNFLLNFTDAAILDRTGRTVLETVADAKTSSVQVKYGNGAMSFDGTGDYLFIPSNPNLDFRTGDFTIEFWTYVTNTNQCMWYSGTTTPGSVSPARKGVVIGVFSASTLWWLFGTNEWVFERKPTYSITINTWIHIAVTRGSGTARFFVNGSLLDSIADTSDLLQNVGTCVGGNANGYAVNGYIDDFRVTKGFARYTANFTPPTGSHRLK